MIKQTSKRPNKAQKMLLGLGVGAGALISGSAMAALPSGASDAMSTLSTDAMAMVDLAWPIATAVTVAFILLKVFKRAARAST